MPIIYVEGELPSSGISIRQGKNGVLVREETRQYTVVSDNAFVDKLEILATAGLPKFGDIIDDMTVRAMSAERHADHQMRWTASVVMSSEVEENQNNPDSTSSDPTTWTPKATLRFEPYQEPLYRDFSNPPKVIANSLGDRFETALERTRRLATIHFTQFEPATVSLDQIMDRSDVVNSITYKTKPPRSLLLCVDEAQLVNINGFRCVRVDYTCKYKGPKNSESDNSNDWLFRPLDHGYRFRKDGKILQFFHENWENGVYNAAKEGLSPIDGLLNGLGGALLDQTGSTKVFLEFKQYPEVDFNDFLRVVFTS